MNTIQFILIFIMAHPNSYDDRFLINGGVLGGLHEASIVDRWTGLRFTFRRNEFAEFNYIVEG